MHFSWRPASFAPNLGKTPLIHAVLGNHIEIVHVLVKAGASLTSVCRGKTPLTLAIMQGNVAIVNILVNTPGANLERQAAQSHDHTALTDAINYSGTSITHEKSAEIVAILLNAKANVNVTIEGGYTPLTMAAYVGNAEVVKMLEEASIKQTVTANQHALLSKENEAAKFAEVNRKYAEECLRVREEEARRLAKLSQEYVEECLRIRNEEAKKLAETLNKYVEKSLQTQSIFSTQTSTAPIINRANINYNNKW